MKPEDIPQDVRDEAMRVYFKRCNEAATLAERFTEAEVLDLLARAIMAERERCAKVSEAFGDAIAIAGPSGEFLSIVPYVAEAIRSGLPVEKVKSLLQKGQLAPGKP